MGYIVMLCYGSKLSGRVSSLILMMFDVWRVLLWALYAFYYVDFFDTVVF